jgi:hypothetical protein
MRSADHASVAFHGKPHGRQGLDDAGVVGNDAVLQRDVEIDSQEEPAPFQIQVSDGFHRPGRIAQ